MSALPPKRALQFLRWFCRKDYLEEIEGDLIELFEVKATQKPWKARWNFRWQVLRHLRPDFIRSFENPHLIHTAMIKHNFLITYRSFLRNKSTFLINLMGLSTGLACVLVIYLWVNDELRVDTFHEKDEQLYKVMHNLEFEDALTWEITPVPLGEALVQEMPEVEMATTVNDFFTFRQKEGILRQGETEILTHGIHASETFFEVFSYPILQGTPDQVLSGEDHIVLSQSLAKRLLGTTENIIGKWIDFSHPYYNHSFQVSGVFADPPPNSTEQFDFVIPLDIMLKYVRGNNANTFVGSYAETFLVLKEGTDIQAFNQKIYPYLKHKDEANAMSGLFVQQYSSKYLHGRYENGKIAGGRITYVRLFTLIALFILLIACVNYMNLSTAKGALKMKEVGIKKTIGASRKTLITQFLSESLLLTFIALFLAMGILTFLLPYFNELTGKQLQLQFETQHLLFLLAVIMLTGLLAGSYPALYLSGFNPIAVLKGKLGMNWGELWIRRGLVIVQFTLSILFIVGVFVINRQIKYTQDKHLGYDKENVITFKWRGTRDEKGFQQYADFLQGLQEIPGVINASNMKGNIANQMERSVSSGISWTGNEAERDQIFRSPYVGYNFIETLNLELIAGRSFSPAFNDGNNFRILINEKAARLMNFPQPVGKVINAFGDDCEIIGVVKDFHYGSLHNAIEPTLLFLGQIEETVLVKIDGEALESTLDRLSAYHQSYHPSYPFEYTFLDQDYQELYESEHKVADLSLYFTGLAIFISCLGLFGLAAFTAERRQKEIGIRKVLGASVYQLVKLLSSDFTQLVGISILIAIPLSYLLASNWLEGFAYKIDLDAGIFILAAGLTLLIASLTVGFQTFRAATLNPVESLRDE